MKNIKQIITSIILVLFLILLVSSYKEIKEHIGNIEILEEQIRDKNDEINNMKSSYEEKMANNETEIANYLDSIEKLHEIVEELQIDLLTSNEEIENLENKIKSRRTKSFRILAYDEGVLRYIYEEDRDNYHIPLSIIGYDASDLLLPQQGIDILDYTDGTGASIKLKILGSLYNLKIIRLGWDAVNQDTYEKRVICELDEVRNQDVLFSSIQAEGMHSEVIKWKDTNGTEHKYYIAYDGFGFAGKIIIVEHATIAD